VIGWSWAGPGFRETRFISNRFSGFCLFFYLIYIYIILLEEAWKNSGSGEHAGPVLRVRDLVCFLGRTIDGCTEEHSTVIR
jgi:hypothetical protein